MRLGSCCAVGRAHFNQPVRYSPLVLAPTFALGVRVRGQLPQCLQARLADAVATPPRDPQLPSPPLAMGRHEDYWTDEEDDSWDREWDRDGLSGAGAAWRRPRGNCPPPPPPVTDQLHAPPAIAVGPAAPQGGGISASTFVSYVAMGFGGTVALIAICVCSFLVGR